MDKQTKDGNFSGIGRAQRTLPHAPQRKFKGNTLSLQESGRIPRLALAQMQRLVTSGCLHIAHAYVLPFPRLARWAYLMWPKPVPLFDKARSHPEACQQSRSVVKLGTHRKHSPPPSGPAWQSANEARPSITACLNVCQSGDIGCYFWGGLFSSHLGMGGCHSSRTQVRRGAQCLHSRKSHRHWPRPPMIHVAHTKVCGTAAQDSLPFEAFTSYESLTEVATPTAHTPRTTPKDTQVTATLQGLEETAGRSGPPPLG